MVASRAGDGVIADGSTEQQLEMLYLSELRRTGSRGGRIGQVLPPVLAFVGLLAAWQLAVMAFDIPRYLLPAPLDIVSVLVRQQAQLLNHSAATVLAIVGGFLLSVAVAVPLSVLVVYSSMFERTIYPLIVATQTIPKVAIAPLFVVWFGFGLTPKVVIAFLVSFFPIVIATVVGLRSTPREMIHLLRCMGASELQVFVRARFPHALPSVFGGLKIGVILAVIGAVVGEFVGADEGLGYLIQLTRGVFDTPLLFAALTQLSLIGIVMFAAVWVLELWILTWHQSDGD